MNSYNKDTINQVIASNPEIKKVVDAIKEENHLFLSRFTHELRNPLTLVKSTIQLIESQHPEVTNFKYWNSLITDLNDTVAILNDLSSYNHCDQLHVSEIDLLEFVKQSVESIQPFASHKSLQLKLTTDSREDIYRTYPCDKGKMKELLTNLLKNAVEAAYSDTMILVELSTKESKTNGLYIYISITNSGDPISPENVTHIFEPFVTTKSGGSGLGLAISKKIANLHKGDLSVSQTDCTVTFTLQIPIDVTEKESFITA